MIAAYWRTYWPSQLTMVGGRLALSLHSSNETGELSQWSRHDDSTINIVISIMRPHRSSMYVDAVYCCVCRSVGLSVTIVSPAKTDEPIEMSFVV